MKSDPPTDPTMTLHLECKEIVKAFGPTIANDKISASFEGGKVYALLGENGAGKTTFLSILFGIYRPDHGEILLNGERVHFGSPKEALDKKIYLVQQSLSLIENFTVAENLALIEKPSLSSLNLNDLVSQSHDLMEKAGFQIDPWLTVEKMPMNFRQRVEILKGLMYDAKILLLDEPTSVLGPEEAEDLGRNLKSLAAEGRVVVFSSHKLEHVIRFADCVTILRAGKVIANMMTSEVKDSWELAYSMVGAEFTSCIPVRDQAVTNPQPFLTVSNLRVSSEKGRVVVDNVSLTLRKGTVLGVAGVAGNGQKELAQTLAGLNKPTSGSIAFSGYQEGKAMSQGAFKTKIGYIPEEGSIVGLVADFTVAENLSLTTYKTESGSLFLDHKAIEAKADSLIQDFGISPPDRSMPVRNLSGGNAHRVVVAREISRPLDLLIAYNPTKGLDIRATDLVHRRIIEKRNSGTAILLVSEDLDELLQLSDDIAVMYEGKITGIRDASGVSMQEIGKMMAGITPQRQVLR